jgi:hypothetical protein
LFTGKKFSASPRNLGLKSPGQSANVLNPNAITMSTLDFLMQRRFLLTVCISTVISVVALAGSPLISGPSKGMRMLPFGPKHVSGPDIGTHTCPICKYGKINGVHIWVNGEKQSTVAKLATHLDQMISKRGLPQLRGVIVFIKPATIAKKKYEQNLLAFVKNNRLKYVAVTYVDGPKAEGIRYYKINVDPKVRTTTLVFSKLKVRANLLNLSGDAASLNALSSSADSLFPKPKSSR